jgi:hypothetical protein
LAQRLDSERLARRWLWPSVALVAAVLLAVLRGPAAKPVVKPGRAERSIYLSRADHPALE